MALPKFKVRHRRPKHLSNPSFEYSREELLELIARPDQQYRWNDFAAVLGPLSAGTYEETVYFLPLAFEHLIRHEADALDLTRHVAWFLRDRRRELENDRLLSIVREAIRACFAHWTAEFHVQHFDREDCKKKSWGLTYRDHVNFSDVICEMMCSLVRYAVMWNPYKEDTDDDLAISFVESLSRHEGDAVKAAWFLELARSRGDVYHPPRKCKPIKQLLTDRALLEAAADVVIRERVGTESSPTYWDDTFLYLGL